MKDFALDPQSNKFIWNRNGLRYTQSNLEYMAQKVRCAISLFLGEWYLNKNLGIPYIPTTMEKIDHRPMLETALQVTISGVKGIKRLVFFETVYDERNRKLQVNFIIQCDNGENLEMTDEVPLQRIVE
jgi:hypothetical protein